MPHCHDNIIPVGRKNPQISQMTQIKKKQPKVFKRAFSGSNKVTSRNSTE